MRRRWVLEACEIDLARQQVDRDGQVIPLTPQEVELFAMLAAAPGRTVPRAHLLREVWGFPRPVRSRAVDNALARLRAKVERDPQAPRHLLTARGCGYRFEPGVPAPTDLVGRAEDLRRLDDAVAGSGRITVTGPAGVGKSALVRAWAGAGVPIVSLLAVDVDAVAATLASGLGVPVTPGGTLAQVGRALRARGVSRLVVDDAESVPGAVVEALDAWAAVAPDLTVVVTSQVPLGVDGEHVVALRPLDVAAGVALFCRRAPGVPEARARPIVERLDGLPLAIELAAARLGRVDLDTLDRLTAHPDALPGDARYATLDHALVATWEGLDPPLQDALCAMALFGTDAPTDGLAEVLGCGPGEVWRRIDALVDRALLTDAAPPVALRLVRWVALERAPQALVHRQAAWLLTHGAGREPQALAAAARVEVAEPALAARLRLLAGRQMLLRGPVHLRVADRAVDCAERSDHAPLLAEALVLRGALRTLCGSLDGAEADLLAAEAMASEPTLIEARARRGWVAVFRGRTEHAGALLTEAQRSAAAAGLAELEAMAHVRLASLRHYEGDPIVAISHLEAALGLYEAVADEVQVTRCQSNLGLMQLETGHPAAAREAILSALERDRAHGIDLAVPQHLLNLGGLELDVGRPAAAGRWMEQAIAAAEEVGDDTTAALALLGAGVARLLSGDPAAAIAILTRARHAFVTGDNVLMVGIAWAWVGAAAAVHGDSGAAEQAYVEARAMVARTPVPMLRDVLALCQAVPDAVGGTTDGRARVDALLAQTAGPRPSLVRAARRMLAQVHAG